MEHIGRELRSAYPLPDDMPRRLRTLVEHLEREITRAENRQGEAKQPGRDCDQERKEQYNE
jgi:hypothetical protein